MNEKKIRMVALARTYFSGWREPGEEFEATPSQANLLTATHKAKIKDEDLQRRTYKRRDMKAEK